MTEKEFHFTTRTGIDFNVHIGEVFCHVTTDLPTDNHFILLKSDLKDILETSKTLWAKYNWINPFAPCKIHLTTKFGLEIHSTENLKDFGIHKLIKS